MIAGAILAASLLLADLPDETLKELKDLPGNASAAELLGRVRAIDGASHFDLGAFSVATDRRWWGSASSGSPGAPIVEFRRWPGDTVLAVYAMTETPAPPIARSEWRPTSAPDGERRFEGKVQTEMGVHPALWCERVVEGSPARLAALLAPGDGGLGIAGLAASRAALLDLWERLTANAERWNSTEALAAGVTVALPAIGPEPREGDERSDPWQTVGGTGFTIGLPPGLRAARVDGEVTPPRAVEGERLWLRGRFRDRTGAAVTVGDANRAGYVALIDAADADWLSGTRPPRGAPRSSRVDALPLDEIVVADTGSRAGRVERWTEEGWPGSWLVFRLAFDTAVGIEIGLPVEGAWRSLALFYIPATIRPESWPPAPPPIDAAERLGLRFERLRGTERARSPLTEGWLTAPGLRVALPRGWYPVVSIRAADGFPITIHEEEGTLAGTLRRLDSSAAAATIGRKESPWESSSRPSVHGAAAVWSRADGTRLFVTRDGDAFVFEPSLEGGTAPAGWRQLTESVGLSRRKKGR